MKEYREFIFSKVENGWSIIHPSEDPNSQDFYFIGYDTNLLEGIEAKRHNCYIFKKNTYRIDDVKEGIVYKYSVPHQDYILEALGIGGLYSKVIRIHGKDIEGRWIFGQYHQETIIDWVKGAIRPNNKKQVYEIDC